jgi:hypothetical protein
MIVNDEEEAERLAEYAIKENPNITNFEEFEQAFLKAFNTSTGQQLLSFLNNEESKILFETPLIRNEIKKNVGEEEYEQVYGETTDMDVFRKVPKGEKTTSKDFIIIEVNKPIAVKTYRKSGVSIKGYSRSYSNWTPSQEKYVISQKAKNLPTKEIITNYNKQFRDEQRPASSIKTKIYRI